QRRAPEVHAGLSPNCSPRQRLDRRGVVLAQSHSSSDGRTRQAVVRFLQQRGAVSLEGTAMASLDHATTTPQMTALYEYLDNLVTQRARLRAERQERARQRADARDERRRRLAACCDFG